MANGGKRDKAGEAEVLGPLVYAACLAAGAAAGAAAAVAATAAAAPWADAAAVVAVVAGAAAALGADAAAAVAAEAGTAVSASAVAAAGAGAWDGKESPTDLQLLNLHASLDSDGAKPWPPHVHKIDVHSAAPEELFEQHQPHAPGTGHGKYDTCYFYNHAPQIKSISKKGKEKRNRIVVGQIGTWHPENCKPIHGPDGSVVGNKRRFSYDKISSSSRVSTGWILFEISPEKQEEGVDQMVLYSIHKSKYKKHPESSTAASSSARAETPSIEPRPGRDESLGSPGAGMQSQAQEVLPISMPALGIALVDTTDILPQAEDFNEHGLNWSTLPDTSDENCFIPNPSSSGVKRKADHDHPEAPPSVRQEMTDKDWALQEIERRLNSEDTLMLNEGDVGDTYQLFKDIHDHNLMPAILDAGGVSATFDPVMTRIGEEDLEEPIGVDDVGDWVRSPTGSSEVQAEWQGLVEMAEGGHAPRRVLEETGHQDWTGLEEFAHKNSPCRSLHGSGGDSTGLVAAVLDIEDNCVPVIGLDDGWDDLDWLIDYPIDDLETE